MEAKRHHFGVLRRSERDRGLGLEMMCLGVNLGIDDVAGDVELLALKSLRGRGAGGQQAGGQNGSIKDEPGDCASRPCDRKNSQGRGTEHLVN